MRIDYRRGNQYLVRDPAIGTKEVETSPYRRSRTQYITNKEEVSRSLEESL
jgi:hypothetical protein